MNEELQNALTDLINKSMELGGDALAFTQEQLPEVLQQLLLYKLVVSLAFTVTLIPLSVFGIFKSCSYWKTHDDDDFRFWMGVFIIFQVLVLFLLMFGMSWLQIWLAPKVYLLEYAANLAR